MQINFLEDIPRKKKPENSKKAVENIKFSNPSKTNNLPKKGKEKKSSILQDIFNYFKKSRQHKNQHNNSLEKSRKEMLDIIRKDKKKKERELTKPVDPKHSGKYKRFSKKINKKENNSKSFFDTFLDFFKLKPSNIAPEFLPKKEKKKIVDIKKVEKHKIEPKRQKSNFWTSLLGFFKRKNSDNKKARDDEKQKAKIINSREKKHLPEKHKVPEVDNPEVLESNLIKTEEDIIFDWGRNLGFLAVAVILSLAIIGLSYWTLGLWGEKKIEQSTVSSREVKDLRNKVKVARENAQEAIEFRDKIKLINTMLDKHIYWSNFFDFLEKNTLKEVYYSGEFNGDIKGQYILSANTRKYELIEAQIEQFYKNPYVVSVETSGGKLFVDRENDVSSVQFDLNLLIKPSLFVKASD